MRCMNMMLVLSRGPIYGWRKVSNPKSRQPAVVEALKNNNQLTRKLRIAKARHRRWVKVQTIWNDTKHQKN